MYKTGDKISFKYQSGIHTVKHYNPITKKVTITIDDKIREIPIHMITLVESISKIVQVVKFIISLFKKK